MKEGTIVRAHPSSRSHSPRVAAAHRPRHSRSRRHAVGLERRCSRSRRALTAQWPGTTVAASNRASVPSSSLTSCPCSSQKRASPTSCAVSIISSTENGAVRQRHSHSDLNPADVTDVVAEAPCSTAAEAAEACEAAARAFDGWRHTPAPTRGQILFKVAAPDGRAPPGARRSADARRGQDNRRVRRRDRACHQRCRVLRRRGPANDRRDDSVRAAGQFLLHGETARGSRGDHHALELSGGDSNLENRPCPRVRQYRRLQAGDPDAPERCAPGRDIRRVRLPPAS